MKRTILAAVLLAGIAVTSLPAQADIVDDPLHGACPGCTAQTIGGNDVTVLGPGGVVGFGFTSSPPGGIGDLQLKFLIPNSFTLTQVNNFVAGVNVTGTNQPVGGTSLSLFSTTPWTSGFLETDYLNNTLANGAPKNPLDAWLGATNTVQASATGYFVALAEVGPFTLGGQSDPLADIFALSPAVFAQGGFIVGNLFTTDGVISTAQSSALFFGGPSGGPFCASPPCDVAVPGPIAGAGIPGLIAACGGLFGLNWRRRRKNNLGLA